MGYPTKIQLIKRKNGEQWYVNFPAAIAQSVGFEKGEMLEWIIEDKNHLVLKRLKPKAAEIKKKSK